MSESLIHQAELPAGVPLGVLDILPNPVLIKGADYRYVWVNNAFETLFQISRHELVGQLDSEFFKNRQVVQCNGGDRRVLENGEVDEAYETVFDADGRPRETITRKSRLVSAEGIVFLVGVMHDITEVVTANRKLEEQSEKLRILADTDPLTKCLNRRALIAEADTCNNPSSALLVLDIDFFKSINDRFGHSSGDAALVHFTNVAKSEVRKGDLFARIGGEEFAAYFPKIDMEELRAIAERIRSEVEKRPFYYQGTEIGMTVSIGGSVSSLDPVADLDGLLRTADQRLYQAKSDGRNRVVLAAQSKQALPLGQIG